MRIANPIYDVVFKYLMEDFDIARAMLSVILDVKIISIEVKAQETIVLVGDRKMKVYYFDFKAVIKDKEGKTKKVLIELQKAKRSLDIIRFRQYLGKNYSDIDVQTDFEGNSEPFPLEIVTVYMLGFKLGGEMDFAVLHTKPTTTNVLTKKVINFSNEHNKQHQQDELRDQKRPNPRGYAAQILARNAGHDVQHRSDRRGQETNRIIHDEEHAEIDRIDPGLLHERHQHRCQDQHRRHEIERGADDNDQRHHHEHQQHLVADERTEQFSHLLRDVSDGD